MSNKQNILFRADSSSTIGTGHIMRDLVLAKQFQDDHIIFAVQDLPGNINYKIIEANYPIEILQSNELYELVALIKELDIDMIVIDHYGIGYEFEKRLKIARSGNALGVKNPTLKILSLDDTYEKHYCDILLNHNIYADKSRYRDLVPENCELRCGAKYTLLRDEFIEEKKKRRKQFKIQNSKIKIFIAMGGADHSNLNIKILKVLEKFPDVNANVVTTMANQYLDELQEYVAGKESVVLHINTDQIAKLMNEADLAIVTPSVTVNEVIYMGVPFIAVQTVDNQLFMTEYLKKNNYFVLDSFDSIALNNSILINMDTMLKGKLNQ